MPEFSETATSPAPVEEVWKLLHDPSRFPEWWSGIETVRTDGPDHYTIWPRGYPDFPMAQHLRTERAGGRVTISCLVSDLEYCWQLSENGTGTRIEVAVEIPEIEAHRLEAQQSLISMSLQQLCVLAAASAAE
jgi:uncharacterized protein YndB with AHSA1/START domain